MQQRVRLHARYQVLKAPFPQSSTQKKRSHSTVNAAALSVLVPGSSSVDHHLVALDAMVVLDRLDISCFKWPRKMVQFAQTVLADHQKGTWLVRTGTPTRTIGAIC